MNRVSQPVSQSVGEQSLKREAARRLAHQPRRRPTMSGMILARSSSLAMAVWVQRRVG
jgi:hypothetical protein